MSIDVTINRNDLSRMLERARSAVSAKSPMAVLQCALLESDGLGLTVSATDSFVSARSQAPASVKGIGRVCADAKRLADCVKSLPAGDVRLVITKDALEVKAGKSRFKLATVDPVSFPLLPTVEHATPLATIEAAELGRLINQGAYAWTTDDARPFLNVALLEMLDGTASIVTTDSARLALASTKTEGPAQKLSIPPRGMGELRKLIDSTKNGELQLHLIQHAASKILVVTAPDATISIQLGDETSFPPYRKVIPAQSKYRATFARELLLDAVKRVSLVSSATNTGGMKMTFAEGELALSAAHEADEADERVECDATFSCELGVNAANFAAALSALHSDEVAVELSGDRFPIVLRSPVDADALAVCMPMNL